MNRIIISIMLLATIASGEHLFSGGREDDWNKNKKGVQDHLVSVLNPQTTNSYTESNVVHYVTNYTHTVSNTNNTLWQINFGFVDESGNNCWIWGYNTLKCGGFDIDAQWAIYEDYCFNNKKLTTGRGIGLQDFMLLNGYTWRTNGAWKVLNIPYVSDIKKVNERKAEFQKEKKK
jgi:hypothetical protein